MPKRSRLNAPSGAQCFPTVFDGVPDTDYQSQCTFWCSVLSDKNPYRQKAKALSSQCTFWCSVLSDLGTWLYGSGALLGSQCTFWCSVLSDPDRPQAQPSGVCLNAPSGAQCFPTHGCRAGRGSVRVVSMHLLVLSAFRLQSIPSPTQTATSQCTFWCSVLSDQLTLKRRRRHNRSQCTFWCSVLSDSKTQSLLARPITVSMHLLVLSAFRLLTCTPYTWCTHSLNAPSGAQCFPTPPPENRATTPFTGTKSPPTWKAPHRIGSHLSN